MRKLLFAAVGVVALIGASLAFARAYGSSVASVTGTFTATTVSHSEQQSCTTTDGKTIQMTNATYTGAALGDVSVAGNVTVHARSVIDTAADLGTVDAAMKIGGGEARFTGVYDHGKVVGLLTGHVGSKHSHATLLANVSAGFSASGGFTDGKVGASDGGSAVELAAGECKPSGDHGKQGGKDNGKKGDGSSHD
jgi:hypothetical protein